MYTETPVISLAVGGTLIGSGVGGFSSLCMGVIIESQLSALQVIGCVSGGAISGTGAGFAKAYGLI